MRPTPSPADSRPNLPKGTRRTKRIHTIRRENVLAAMNPRYPTSCTLEPFLGTYRIVWDSESNYDPRDALFDDARPDRDPDDGLLTLTRPQRAQAWPKEPTPSSSVVLRFYDSFIGAHHTASILKPSPRPTPVSDSPPLNASRSASSLLSPVSPLSSPSPSPYLSPSPTSSSSLSRTPSSSAASARDNGFWRFDWDPSFPLLGFRHEGMDLTGACGHALSFSPIRDDRGCPFAVVDLRPSGWGEPERRGREGRDGQDGGVARRRRYITVVAKRVPDRYAREGLSDAERTRLGMIELDDFDAGLPFD